MARLQSRRNGRRGCPLDELVFCIDHEPERGVDVRLGDEKPSATTSVTRTLKDPVFC